MKCHESAGLGEGVRHSFHSFQGGLRFLLTHRTENPAGHGSKEVKGKTHTYYQVLIDARDCPHIVSKQDGWAGDFLHGKPVGS